ncbi:methylated-DNA--[protein]-cysteine S-methyltransferase [Pedobacter sp. PAMC26386]|nr:methylated-DNA--[protein]-cysteine S-methyltransferase [Pedobacter sp. PAMC26386]
MIKEYCTVVHSPIGEISIYASDNAVFKVSFHHPPNPTLRENELSHHAATELSAYFDGSPQPFTFPNQQDGTQFQQSVWQVLKTIPYGTTISYAIQSLQLGNPLAIRAIASANGKNDLAIIVPCHRVIGSSGKLVGFAGGLWRKHWLLNHEHEISQQGQLQLKF